MAPAKEQARFHKLIGHWKGSGKWKLSPEAPASEWTTVTTARSVLGGHFVREDVRIDFGEYAPAPLIVRTYFGYDKETKKWMAHSVNNTGAVEANEVHWEDGKMLIGKSFTEQGKLVVERWSQGFEADSYSFNIYRAVGNGKPFAHANGTFKRQKVADAAFGKPGTPAFMPAAKEMGKFAKWAGTYRVKGWMIMSPEIPKMEIAATEIMRPIHGGTVLDFVLHGDPIPNFGGYEARGAWVWSALDNCYRSISVDSMGKASIQSANWVGKDFVVGASRIEGGVPVSMQTTLECGADGTPKSVAEYKISGSAKPIHSFQASYTKKQDRP